MSGQTDISVAVSTATTDSSGRTSVKLNDKAIIYADMLSDEDVFKNTWSETFVDVISGQQIYQAICGKAGDQVDMPITKITKDFVRDKAKLSDRELNSRYYKIGSKLFNKVRQPLDPTANNNITVSIEEFAAKYYNLRKMIGRLAKPRIEAVWLSRFRQFFPEYTFGNGRKVTCVDDFLEAIVMEPYDNRMRELVHTVQNVMWGTGNNWAVIVEAKIMQVLGLEYKDEYVDLEDGQEKARSHLGNSIKTLIVNRKGRICNQPIKRKLEAAHKENLYVRNVGKSKSVAKVIRASTYDGWIGICHGHPSLPAEEPKEKANENAASAATPMAGPRNNEEIRKWIELQLAAGVTSLDEIIHAARNNDSQPLDIPVALPVQIPLLAEIPFPTKEAAGQCVSPLASDVSTLATSSTMSVDSTPQKKVQKRKHGANEVNKKAVSNKTMAIPMSPAKLHGPPPNTDRRTMSPASPSNNTRSRPTKKSKSTVCNVNHLDPSVWVEWQSGYWTEEYQRRCPGAPKYCTGYCGQQEDGSVVPKRIVSDRKRYNSSPNTCQLVSASKYGVVCPNSQHSSHKCMWAMCNECKQTHRKIVSGVMKLVDGVPVNTNDQQQSLSRPKRGIKQRIDVQPGEKMVGGNIVAVAN